MPVNYFDNSYVLCVIKLQVNNNSVGFYLKINEEKGSYIPKHIC